MAQSLYNNSLQENKKGGLLGNMMLNPILRKLSKIEGVSETEKTVTYGGIMRKTLYFIIMLVVGIGLEIAIHSAGGPGITYNDDVIPYHELIIAVIGLLLTIIVPIITWFTTKGTPVLGTLYCLGNGFVIAFSANAVGGEYVGAVWLALILTVALVLAMSVLYISGIVKVNQKFKSVVSTLFFASLISGGLGFIASFIPALQPMVQFFTGNSIFGIIGSVVFIIIGALFLLVDFETINDAVKNKLPKKYEWVASFGLVFTVIWLYLKILNLILKATSKK